MKISKFKLILPLALILASNAYAGNSFQCPDPDAIFILGSAPGSFGPWFGPALPTSKGIGGGMGGSHAGAFIGSSSATVNGQNGWICYYGSNQPASTQEIYRNINKLPANVQPLIEMLNSKNINITGMGIVGYEAK